MQEKTAIALADAASSVALSIDGADAAIHDAIRARAGAFERGMKALDVLHRVRDERRSAGRDCFTFGIDYTLTRSGAKEADLERFVEATIKRFPRLDFIRFGAVIPSGLGRRAGVRGKRASLDPGTDRSDRSRPAPCCPRRQRSRHFHDRCQVFPASPRSERSRSGHSADRTRWSAPRFPIYEAKVGNVLHEFLDILWPRVRAWRSDPFVAKHMETVQSMADWANTTRILDRRYGSPDDQERIGRRGPLELAQA